MFAAGDRDEWRGGAGGWRGVEDDGVRDHRLEERANVLITL